MKPTKQEIEEQKIKVQSHILKLNKMLNEYSEAKGALSVDIKYWDTTKENNEPYSVELNYDFEV